MGNQPFYQQPNTLGKASLGLSIASLVLVFGIGLCALVGAAQGWVQLLGTPLFVCGASSAFLGIIGAVLGFAGGNIEESKTLALCSHYCNTLEEIYEIIALVGLKVITSWTDHITPLPVDKQFSG